MQSIKDGRPVYKNIWIMSNIVKCSIPYVLKKCSASYQLKCGRKMHQKTESALFKSCYLMHSCFC